MSSYFGDTKITNLGVGYGGTTSDTSSTTAKATVYGGKLNIVNYNLTASLGHSDGNYFRISSSVPTLFDTNGIIIPKNKVGINFRYDTSTYATALSYKTDGNEALCLDFSNSVTSFIIRTKAPVADSGWASVVPTFQAKNQRVTINKLISNGNNAAYNLDVNGTANATTIYENGAALSSIYGKVGSRTSSSNGSHTHTFTGTQATISSSGSAASAGAHTHTVSASATYTPAGSNASNGAHTHTVSASATYTPAGSNASNGSHSHTVTATYNASTTCLTLSTASAGSHSHTFTGTQATISSSGSAASAGSHSHTFTGTQATISSSGSAASDGAHTHTVSASATYTPAGSNASNGAHTHTVTV